MKGRAFIELITKVASLFLDMVPSSNADIVSQTSSADVYVEDKSECKAAWALHMNKTCFTAYWLSIASFS